MMKSSRKSSENKLAKPLSIPLTKSMKPTITRKKPSPLISNPHPENPQILYLHPSLYQKPCTYGMGTFTKDPIPSNTIILREKIHNIPDKKNEEYRYKLIKYLLTFQKNDFLKMVPLQIEPHIDLNYSELRKNHQKHLPDLTEDEMKLYYLKIKHNIFGFGNNPGILFYGTRMNHSCHPNVTYFKFRNYMIFKTTRPVSMDSEILDSYIDSSLPRDERQSILKQRYGFQCGCEKCISGG